MRLPKLTYEELNPRQREVFDKHATRRKYVSGPYNVWLHICLNSAEVDVQADRPPPFPDVRGFKKPP